MLAHGTNYNIRIEIEQHRYKKKVKGLLVTIALTDRFHKLLKRINKALELPKYVIYTCSFSRIMDHSATHKLILVSDSFVMEDIVDYPAVELIETEIELSAKNFTTQYIFNWFTKDHPDEHKRGAIPYPNSFETVGHMANYNLTADQAEYKKYIGYITLFKCPNILTVVHKTYKLHNVYRTPTLYHMAGYYNYLVKVRYVGVIFELDFQKVYWCSRLQQERDRVLTMLKKGYLLADIFCGVGPLAVRAAKKGLTVIANDLNPYCHEYLYVNCKLNKVTYRVLCWNMCARYAICKIYQMHYDNYNHEINQNRFYADVDHIYMNLPVDAIEFLDVLVDYCSRMEGCKMPLVHVNCFVVADSDEKSVTIIAARIQKVLPGFKQEDIEIMHHIKNVTIFMRMYCVSFRLRPSYKAYQNYNYKHEVNVEDDNGYPSYGLVKYDNEPEKHKQPKKQVKSNVY